MKVFLKLLAWLLRLASLFVGFLILLFIASYAKPYIADINSYPYLFDLFNFEHQITSLVGKQLHKIIPTTVQGFDLVRPILILVGLFLLGQLRLLKHRVQFYEYTSVRYERELEKIIKTTHLDENNKEIVALKHDIEELQYAKGKRRKDLILHFMEVKGKLEAYKHELAFLSIDVVGSTAMKKSENAMVISADFYRYNELADKVLATNNALKVAKTPDGIMAAFNSADQAVSAGQQLINELEHFNKFVKKMKSEFQIRCGINVGMVYFDPEEPLEHISDRVIDIAGHMQKEAEPNTINIAKSAIAPLDKTSGFTSAEKVIDEQAVYTWKPK